MHVLFINHGDNNNHGSLPWNNPAMGTEGRKRAKKKKNKRLIRKECVQGGQGGKEREGVHVCVCVRTLKCDIVT